MNAVVLERDDRKLDTAQQAASRLGMRAVAGEPLARHTTFRIGGPADLYAVATTVDQLSGIAGVAENLDLQLTILGGGSNVLVSDAGIRGLVVANQTRGFGHGPEFVPSWLQQPGAEGQIIAESGVLVAGLARWAVRNGWSGLEWAVSVPGTVGGAVIGNAGAHGTDVAASLAWALVSYPPAERKQLSRADLAYAYRTSVLKEQLLGTKGKGSIPVVLAAAFGVARGDPEELTARADAYLARRRASQPVEPSAGSIFRNPPGDYAGRLIEAAGLKGYRSGGAEISKRHANFIVNTGDARAEDVVAIINMVRRTVQEVYEIALVPEILFIGEWQSPPLWEV